MKEIINFGAAILVLASLIAIWVGVIWLAACFVVWQWLFVDVDGQTVRFMICVCVAGAMAILVTPQKERPKLLE